MANRMSFSTKAEANEVAERFRAQKLSVKVVRRGSLWYLDVEEPVSAVAGGKPLSLADVQARADIERETQRQRSELRRVELEYMGERVSKSKQARATEKGIAADIKARAVKYARAEAEAKAPLDVATPRTQQPIKKPSRFRQQYTGRKTYRTAESANIMAEQLRKQGRDATVRKTPYGHQIMTLEGKRGVAKRAVFGAVKKVGPIASRELFRKYAEHKTMAEHPVRDFRWRREGNIGSKLPKKRAPVGKMPRGRPRYIRPLDTDDMKTPQFREQGIEGYYTGKKGGD